MLIEAELTVLIGNGNSVNEANQELLIKEAIFPTANRNAVIWVSRMSRKIIRAGGETAGGGPGPLSGEEAATATAPP